ncbi:hypothetical protein HN873_047833 [Arachis hypogaea]
MEMITSDPDFHNCCCQLMMFKPAREMFVSLKDIKCKKERHEESKLLSIIEEDTDDIENIFTLIGQYAANYLCKKPCRTSEQTDYLWVQEILCGHDIRCYEIFQKHVFFFNFVMN